jgi:hypothetical protein
VSDDARLQRAVARELHGGTKRRFTRLVLGAMRCTSARRTGPLVTVVIATYNCSTVLRFAIQSVRRR